MPDSTRPSFESCLDKIDIEIYKRRPRWNLTAITWMDFEDVAQIIRIHLYDKWEQYDPARPLAQWVNTVITNQTRNIVRNIYTNYARPCLKCALAEGNDGCRKFVKQCAACPLYAKWEKTRKRAHDAKLTLPLEHHAQEVYNQKDTSINVEKSTNNLHQKMQKLLKPIEWKIYQLLYIDEKDEEEVTQLMKWKTTEAKRIAGYKRLKVIKKIILNKARACCYNEEIIVF